MIFLNFKSEFSPLESLLSMDEIVAQANGAVGVNFGGDTYGALHFYKKALSLNVKPIFVFEKNISNRQFLIIPTNFNSYSKFIRNNIDDLLYERDLIKISLEDEKVEGENIFYAFREDGRAHERSVYVPSIRYLKQEEKDLYRVMQAIKNGCRYESFACKDYHLPRLDSVPEIAIRNTHLIAELVDLKIPEIENWRIENDNEILREKLQEGADRERLEYELEVIAKKGLSSYFLLVEDIVREAKSLGILTGPGRGSSVSSYVCYLLGITSIDPRQYNLIFERFLNPERVSLPDIDIDVENNCRNELIEELRKKYRVFELINFSRFTLKSAQIAVERVGGPKKLAEMLDGKVASKTLHPAGIIVSDNLENIVKVEDGVAQIDLKELEMMGGVKIDLLPLRTLSILDHLLEVCDVSVCDIKLDDKDTYKNLADAKTENIFQLESESAKKILRVVKPKNIEELADVLALNRPAALQNGMLPKYTRGEALIYQEQLMKLLSSKGLNLKEADIVLRGIIKKDRASLERFRGRLVDSELRNILKNFASYSFPKSHAIAYAYISYYLAFFQTHYKMEFALAIAESEGNTRGMVEVDVNWSDYHSKYLDGKIVKGFINIDLPKAIAGQIIGRRKEGIFLSSSELSNSIEVYSHKLKSLLFEAKLFKTYDYKIRIILDGASMEEKGNLEEILRKLERGSLQVEILEAGALKVFPLTVSELVLRDLRDLLKGRLSILPYP